MPYARLHTACIRDATVIPIVVEVDIHPGLPVFSVIGLPDKGLEEARQRVRSAIKNAGFSFPQGRVTVSLSPADVRKQGSSFDLAIALGILAAQRVIPYVPEDVLVFGELGLKGEVRPVSRLAALLVDSLAGEWKCLVPRQGDVDLVAEAATMSVGSLEECALLLRRPLRFEPGSLLRDEPLPRTSYAIDQVRGHVGAKRALEVALAGGHNLLLVGPPGTGKTMLAKAAIQLLPPPSRKEQLEIMSVRSVAGLPVDQADRPFREPHHHLTPAALLGTASGRPGELVMAHRGILFLDEMPEVPRVTLEALRQPLQDKQIRLSSMGTERIQPADCILIGAQNLCPCGLTGVPGRICHCAARDVVRYRRTVSEPLLDRFELFCEVPAVSAAEAIGSEANTGRGMAVRIAVARAAQEKRGGLNASLTRRDFSKVSVIDDSSRELLQKAVDKLYLSTRSVMAVLRVSRTIADLEGAETIASSHISEALQYRRNLFV